MITKQPLPFSKVQQLWPLEDYWLQRPITQPISKSSSIASLKDEDDILDQLARQTSMALKGGKVPLEDDSTSSSDGATPAPGSVPSTYDVISLTF